MEKQYEPIADEVMARLLGIELTRQFGCNRCGSTSTTDKKPYNAPPPKCGWCSHSDQMYFIAMGVKKV